MTIMQLSRGFWEHLTRRRKHQLAMLLILMVMASFAEVLSLGAVLPFLGVLTQPEQVFRYESIQFTLKWLQIDTPAELILPVTIAFISAALLAGGMRLLLLYVSTKLSFAIGADFSYQIYRRTLYQPYAVHVSRNSSEIISGVTNKVMAVINNFLAPVLNLLSSSVILVAILVALLAIDPKMSLAALVGFALIYGCVIILTRKRLTIYSRRVSIESTQVIKVLQEGLGGIRDVLIDGVQETYCRLYRQADLPLRHAQANNIIIGNSPRFAAEALGMTFIAVLAFSVVSSDGGVVNAIGLLGALALGAQRLLPVMQQGYLSIVQLRSGRDSLQDALTLLNQPIDQRVYGIDSVAFPFRESIHVCGIGFRYTPDTPFVLRHLTLRIPRGSCIGFIGTTGSGKSTLLDILMGLLVATEGEVRVDDTLLGPRTQRAWQHRIAHVPQAIYLSDATIAENIAFGVPRHQIDRNRLYRAAEQAQIATTIMALPNQYETEVGERGMRLSGGQRQRIGIARALYKNAEVIVLDEATSALDSETESAVMSAIDGLGEDLTILIIAHRLSTLQRCDQIVELQGGRILRVGTYSEIVESST